MCLNSKMANFAMRAGHMQIAAESWERAEVALYADIKAGKWANQPIDRDDLRLMRKEDELLFKNVEWLQNALFQR